jgi:hypothetical protein
MLLFLWKGFSAKVTHFLITVVKYFPLAVWQLKLKDSFLQCGALALVQQVAILTQQRKYYIKMEYYTKNGCQWSVAGTEQVGINRLSKVLKGDPWWDNYMCVLPRCASPWGITKAVTLLEAKVYPEETREEVQIFNKYCLLECKAWTEDIEYLHGFVNRRSSGWCNYWGYTCGSQTEGGQRLSMNFS